jgi:N-methylhydantoinase A
LVIKNSTTNSTMKNSNYRLGIDIGGTFTDLTLLDQENGRIVSLKTPTVPADPAQGIANGLALLGEKGVMPSDIHYFVHGTTIGLNTLLQRRGAEIALFATEGFQDLLSLQRLRLPVPYDFRSRLPEPLIARKHVFPIHERMLHDGTVHQAIDTTQLDEAIDAAVAAKVGGIVVCLLHSYKNASNEEQVAERIRTRAPGLEVSISSKLWPQMREYERAVMTAVNMYIQLNVKRYFETLKERLATEGMPATPFITQSNGGIMDIGTAAEAPVRTLFSGPAAGVIGAVRVAESAGIGNVITFDVGGTSADISIIEGGKPTFVQTNHLAGFPIMLPSISIYSVGAGGGSFAWIDKGGLLKVGPESVGSNPGPACYGQGCL